MKTTFTFAIMLLFSLRIAAQVVNDEPTVSRNQKGIVESVEFPMNNNNENITKEGFLSDYKLTESYESSATELYNLKDGPSESYDLSA